MFGRKNQTILSSHYGKLVEQDETSGLNAGDDDGEDFFSLKRADHDLPTDLAEYSDLSKRKIRMMKSKKALAKAGPRGTKLVFDDDGQAHQLYEFKHVKDVDVERDGAEFMKKEIGKMQRADADDKAVAKEKKREKKRKRKEREREEVSLTMTSSTSLRVYRTQRFRLSVVRTGNIVVLPLFHPQTTMATFPRRLISQSQKMIERNSLPHRTKNLAKRTNFLLRWRRKKNLQSSSYDDEDPYRSFVSTVHLLIIQHILRGPT